MIAYANCHDKEQNFENILNKFIRYINSKLIENNYRDWQVRENGFTLDGSLNGEAKTILSNVGGFGGGFSICDFPWTGCISTAELFTKHKNQKICQFKILFLHPECLSNGRYAKKYEFFQESFHSVPPPAAADDDDDDDSYSGDDDVESFSSSFSNQESDNFYLESIKNLMSRHYGNGSFFTRRSNLYMTTDANCNNRKANVKSHVNSLYFFFLDNLKTISKDLTVTFIRVDDAGGLNEFRNMNLPYSHCNFKNGGYTLYRFIITATHTEVCRVHLLCVHRLCRSDEEYLRIYGTLKDAYEKEAITTPPDDEAIGDCTLAYMWLLKEFMCKYLNGKFTVIPADTDTGIYGRPGQNGTPSIYMVINIGCKPKTEIRLILDLFHNYLLSEISQHGGIFTSGLRWEIFNPWNIDYKNYKESKYFRFIIGERRHIPMMSAGGLSCNFASKAGYLSISHLYGTDGGKNRMVYVCTFKFLFIHRSCLFYSGGGGGGIYRNVFWDEFEIIPGDSKEVSNAIEANLKRDEDYCSSDHPPSPL